MSGRFTCAKYKELQFEQKKVWEKGKVKYVAVCKFCKQTQRNSERSRLSAHRKVCGTPQNGNNHVMKTHSRMEEVDGSSESDEDTDAQREHHENISGSSESDEDTDAQREHHENIRSTSKTQGKPSPQAEGEVQKAQKRKRNPSSNMMSRFVDKITDDDISSMGKAIGRLLFYGNLPFRLVEKQAFKQFIQTVRPALSSHIPSRKIISTKILDDVYQEDIAIQRKRCPKEAVLLVDSWKNCSNSKVIAFLIQTVDGPPIFLEAYDATLVAETGELLADRAYDAKRKAEEEYKTRIFAVVSDNASQMMKMGREVQHIMMHSTCNSHSANRLGLAVTDEQLTNKVTNILKTFKRPKFERIIKNRGGERIKLYCETRWNSYKDSYECFVKNLPHMRAICAEQTISSDTAQSLYDEEFISEVKKYIRIFEPICALIDTCQSRGASLATAGTLWLEMERRLPAEHSRIWKKPLETRLQKVLTPLLFCGIILHPWQADDKLTREQRSVADQFLVRRLIKSKTGMGSLSQFHERSGIFGILMEMRERDPIIFWVNSRSTHPDLAGLALQILRIPASSGEIERLFSQWGIIQTPLRNRLTFERSRKLIEMYYNSQVAEAWGGGDINFECDDEDEEEEEN